LWFSPSRQQEPHNCSHTPPLPPSGMGRRTRRKRQKLVGCDKNSLTEQRRENKITTRILCFLKKKQKIYTTGCNFSHHPMLSLLLSSEPPCSSTHPHLNTKHDVTWHRISHLTGWFGSAQAASCEN